MLKTLKLTNQSVFNNDELGSAIAENLPGLRHLELTWCNLSDTGLREILERCRHLQVVYLQKCYAVDLMGELGKRCSQQIKCYYQEIIVEVRAYNESERFKFLKSGKELPTIMTSNVNCISTIIKCIAK
nr:putative F-box/LRR-repeat protein 23 [Tanacetum cinerariifolium]